MTRRKPQPAAQAELLPPEPLAGTIRKGDRITTNEKGSPLQGAKIVHVEQPIPDARPKRDKPARPKGTALAVAEPPAQREAKSVLAIIADAASNPAINPDNMRALLDMQKEIMAEQSRRDFNDAFLQLQSELPIIRQDRRIEIRAKDAKGERTGPIQQSTPYATFQAIMKAVQPLLKKHGFSIWYTTEPAPDGRLMVRTHLAGYGHERTTDFPLPAETSGSKNNLQGWGSTQSYGKRYGTVAILNIISEAPEDSDTDGHFDRNLKPSKDGFAEPADVKLITTAQRNELLKAIDFADLPIAKFLGHYGIAKVDDLPASLFEPAKEQIKQYQANKAAKRNG